MAYSWGESSWTTSAPTVRNGDGEHLWRLRDVEFEDGLTTRCFECSGCGAVRYE